MRNLILCGVCTSLSGAILLLAPVAAQASTYDCTSSPAIEVILSRSHISLRTACQVVGKLEAWLQKDHDQAKLDQCSKTGASTLLLHSFDGYKLREVGRLAGGLVMTRGDSSFEVGGYSGWPTGCGL
ncbi:MAG: hypothetical protein ABSH51_26650 [Solirubrobacteraceae bacterium]